jgi:enterochelin esterase family protein
MRRLYQLAVLVIGCGLASAQTAPSFRSTEIVVDGRVTFRFFEAHASRVELLLENRAQPLAMQRDGAGVWSVTTPSLRPEIYGYRFRVDGDAKTMHDPQNQNRRYGNDLLLVPGHPGQPWEEGGVPRGAVTSHDYTTRIVNGLPGNKSEYVVYTPPGYDAKAKPYPVLYLLHCWGDRPDSWVRFGQANLIFDSLIAQHKAKPMVVVMPLGYGEMNFADSYQWEDRAAVDRNLRLFERALLEEVMPRVEAEFNIRRDAAGTAIMGASMGGLESVAIGLNHGSRFGWVGAESAALKNQDFAKQLSDFRPDDRSRRLIWMVCGRDDELAESNRQMASWLGGKGATVALEQPEGTHSYIIWREGLVRFASMIF